MINLSLKPELENFIDLAVKLGRYSSAEEVVNTALQLLQEREMETSTPTPEPLLSELTGDLIGAIDSQAEPHHQSQKSHFGEQLAKKLSSQGIRRP